MNVTFRPIDQWPGELTKRRPSSPFKAGYMDTERLLRYEVGKLDGKLLVAQLAIEEVDLKVDGRPKLRANYQHPGVIVSFESKHGPLRYATDQFNHWHANLRAVALGLEALRKVDRYGISKRGEQYTGWRALESSGANFNAAQELLDSYGGLKEALKATHPDRGGDPDQFGRVQEARRVLGL